MLIPFEKRKLLRNIETELPFDPDGSAVYVYNAMKTIVLGSQNMFEMCQTLKHRLALFSCLKLNIIDDSFHLLPFSPSHLLMDIPLSSIVIFWPPPK